MLIVEHKMMRNNTYYSKERENTKPTV